MLAKILALAFVSTVVFSIQIFADDEKEIHYNEDCSELYCGAIVSKCMLLKSCNCSMTPADLVARNCSCCRDCVTCLGDLFSKCCPCVGLCNSSSAHDCLSLKSSIYALDPTEEQLGLYNAITEGEYEENLQGMKIKSFPVTQSQFFSKIEPEVRNVVASIPGLNCTVIYLPKCMPEYECQYSCKSLGASSVRWFYTGCCECVGQYCIDAGINANLCEYCTDLEEENNDHCQKLRQKNKIRSDEL